MKKTLTLTFVLLLYFGTFLQAQRIQNSRQSFTYVRNPLKPFNSELKTYTVEVKISAVGAGESREEISRKMENAITLHGYQKIEEQGDIRIVLSLGQSEITAIHERTTEHKTKQGDKEVVVQKYHYDIEIRYPLHLGVFKGQEIVDGTHINKSNDYVYATTPMSNDRPARTKWWNDNKETFIRNWKKSQLDANLSEAQKRVENLFAYTPTREHQSVYSASRRRVDYSDLDKAQQLAMAAYSKVNVADGFNDEFTKLMNEAILIWKSVLNEYDANDKKARINAKVASSIQRNLIVSYCWMGNFDASLVHNAELASIDRVGERWANHLYAQIRDRKARLGQMEEGYEFEELADMDDDDDGDDD
jgi:hypothetical protein